MAIAGECARKAVNAVFCELNPFCALMSQRALCARSLHLSFSIAERGFDVPARKVFYTVTL